MTAHYEPRGKNMSASNKN